MRGKKVGRGGEKRERERGKRKEKESGNGNNRAGVKGGTRGEGGRATAKRKRR